MVFFFGYVRFVGSLGKFWKRVFYISYILLLRGDIGG